MMIGHRTTYRMISSPTSGSEMILSTYCIFAKQFSLSSFNLKVARFILIATCIAFGSTLSKAQSCSQNDIGFNGNTATNTLAICVGANPNTINGGTPSGGPTYQWQVSTVGVG